MIDQKQHRQILYNLIKDIFSLPYAKHIAFKWGTACYFLHGLDRFSTDIDLDIRRLDLSNLNKDIIAIARKYGTVKDKQHIILSYQTWFDHIKIDLNWKPWKNNIYETVNFYWTDIIVQDKATICTNKLIAFLERGLNRDIYDSYFFLKNNFPINEKVIEERKWYWIHTLYWLLFERINLLWANYKILDGLWEVLDDAQKTFVKNHLLQDLQSLLHFKKDFW